MDVLAIDPLIQMRDLFSFSPFGLCCRECGSEQATITFDERCILRHLRKHKLNIPVAVVRHYLEESTKQVELARASRSIESYRIEIGRAHV